MRWGHKVLTFVKGFSHLALQYLDVIVTNPVIMTEYSTSTSVTSETASPTTDYSTAVA